MNKVSLENTPLANVNCHFAKYVEDKKLMLSKHMDGNGIPDYAYTMDYEHRKRLDKMPGIYNLAKKLCAYMVPQALQEFNTQGVAVGPNQYPEIYKMVCDCAEILGIGIPNVLIIPSLYGDEFNAATFAMDDVEPVIVVTGLMIERMSSRELKSVIAHECGHIHNNHSLYGILENYIINIGASGMMGIPGIGQFMGYITQGAVMAINMWSRAAEVTADRAALICTGDPDASKSALAKFMYNGADLSGSIQSELNIDALREQLNMTLNNPYRLSELMSSHPISIKRVFATMDFAECEKYYEWRPDLKTPEIKLCSKEETDKKCKQYIDVVIPKGAKNK